MARYTRMQILDLCNDLETEANAVVSARPVQAGRMKAAAMLLRLTTQLADIKEIDVASNNELQSKELH